MPFKALYKDSRLVLGDPESHIGIITLWTKTKELVKNINPSEYAVMGNLYSAERGLDILVRNLLANPQITNLIITGVDFSKSGIVLSDFFERGFYDGRTETTEKPVWRVRSNYEGYVEKDIPANVLELLRETVNIRKVNKLDSFDFTSLAKPIKKREKMVFMKPPENMKKHYVGEDIGYIIRGKRIAEVWLKILDTVMKFGKISGTHYDDEQKEVINLMSIISEEDPDNLYVPEYLPGDMQHVKEYIPRITQDLPGGVHKNEYTYGSRMRSWFMTDQVRNAVEKLVREPISRAVVINLWDSVKDLTIGGSPCLNHIWFRIRDGKLSMSCVFRSHDMFEGYPENAYGLRVLQEEIRKDVVAGLREKGSSQDIKLGDLVILSQSAHIYDDSWDRCEAIVKKYLKQGWGAYLAENLDPRGNILVSADNGKIAIQHTSRNNETLGFYEAYSAEEMRDILMGENIISLVPHAIDIGIELAKAEHAMKLGIDYRQDVPLDLSKLIKQGKSR